MRKTFTPNQKVAVAIAGLKEIQSISQIASQHEIHPTQVKQWTAIAKAGLPLLFTDKRKKDTRELQDKIDQLYRLLGQRDCELEWLKKKLCLDSP